MSFDESLPEDKRVVWKRIVEDHAEGRLTTKDAEEKLSDVAGQAVHMIEGAEPLFYDKVEDMQDWGKTFCEKAHESADNREACVASLSKWVNGSRTLDEVVEDLSKLTGRKKEEIQSLIDSTCPCRKSPV